MNMKRLFTFLLTASILVSCSDWKYSNGVKSHKGSYTTLNNSKKSVNEITDDKNVALTVKDENIVSESAPIEPFEPILENQNTKQVNTEERLILVKTKVLEQEEDSIKEVDPLILKEALDAEDQGRRSRNFGIASLILQLLPFFGILGLVFGIIGLSKGIQSLRAAYNTPKGVSMAKTGVVISSITIALYTLLLVLLVVLILSFFL